MSDVIRIYGMAPNLSQTPLPTEGEEVWLSNWHRGYARRIPKALEYWTAFFNLHSRAHMESTYPTGVAWYKQQDNKRPIYFQKQQPDISGSQIFPREHIERAFPEAIGPKGHFYSTCTVCWLIPFAILKKPKRIELWGFELRDKSPLDNNGMPRSINYLFERPCFFYWVQKARDRGIEVFYQPEVEALPCESGDPSTYCGPVYGYETKPEI